MLEWQPVAEMKNRMIQAAITDEALDEAMAIECQEPEIDDDLRWIWRAYWRMSESRVWLGGGFGASVPAPITFETVIAWAQHHAYDDDMAATLEACVREIDKTYIQSITAKAKK